MGAFVSNSFLLADPDPAEELFLNSFSLWMAILWVDFLTWFSSNRSLKSSSAKNTCPRLDRWWSGEAELEVVGDMVREGD